MVAYSKLNDSIISHILSSEKEELRESREILERIHRRELYKCVGQTRPEDERLLKRVSTQVHLISSAFRLDSSYRARISSKQVLFLSMFHMILTRYRDILDLFAVCLGLWCSPRISLSYPIILFCSGDIHRIQSVSQSVNYQSLNQYDTDYTLPIRLSV